MRVLVTVLLALALVPLVLPAPGAAQDGGPRVAIASPPDGATLRSSTVEVRLDVSGFRLVEPALSAGNAEGEGHVHVTFDGKAPRVPWPDAWQTAAERYVLTGLGPGAHVVRAELVRADHTPLDPPVFAEAHIQVAEDAPYLAFRDGRPAPGAEVEDGSVRAEVAVRRAPAQALLDPEVRWSLDGKPVEDASTERTFENLTGIHRLRADLLLGGRPLSPPVWDEVVVGLPRVAWDESPESVVAEDPSGAEVPVRVRVEGAFLASQRLRVTVDGEEAFHAAGQEFRVRVPIGTHVIAAELVDDEGRSLRPVVGDAAVVVVLPPPPVVRFQTPAELATMPPNFIATVDVENFTVGADGVVRWRLDGETVAEGTATSHRFEGLRMGMRSLEAQLLDGEGVVVANATRRVHVEPPPTASVGDAADDRSLPAAGVAVAAAVVVAAALVRRRR